MEEFIKALKKEFGDGIVARTEDILNVIPTGSLALDISIGVGGIPKSKFTEIYGPEGSGKTTLVLETCKNALAQGDNALFVDAENMLDIIYTESIFGYEFDEDTFTIKNPDTDAVMVVVQPETGEDALHIVERGLASGEFGLIVIDSVGALAPKREKEKSLDDSTVAEIPRLLSKFLRRAVYFVKHNDVAVVFVGQVRDKIGSYMGGYESTGGHALKHFCSVRISLGKGQNITEGKDKIGVNTPFNIKKNKVSSPYRSFTFPIIFGKGIDGVRDTVEFCKFLGVIKTRGAYYVDENGETIAQGMNNVVEKLENDKETLDKFRNMCYNMVVNDKNSIEFEESLEEHE